MILVSIQDIKSVYMGVVPDRNDDTAIRSFRTLCSGASDIGKYPADYRLWKLAEFDQDTGAITVLDKPVLLADGASFAKGGV